MDAFAFTLVIKNRDHKFDLRHIQTKHKKENMFSKIS